MGANREPDFLRFKNKTHEELVEEILTEFILISKENENKNSRFQTFSS